MDRITDGQVLDLYYVRGLLCFDEAKEYLFLWLLTRNRGVAINLRSDARAHDEMRRRRYYATQWGLHEWNGALDSLAEKVFTPRVRELLDFPNGTTAVQALMWNMRGSLEYQCIQRGIQDFWWEDVFLHENQRRMERARALCLPDAASEEQILLLEIGQAIEAV